MKLVNSYNCYTFILTEDEWYSATEQQRLAWINQIMRESMEAECRYLSILVKPDEVMSISPIAGQHKVWSYTFPTTDEGEFRKALVDIQVQANVCLTKLQMATIAKKVFWP